jgi:hypothetical protein
MRFPRWLRPALKAFQWAERRIGLTSKIAVGAATATVSLSTALSRPLEAQTSGPPDSLARPPRSAPRDTVRRYGEKFILTSSDSVVIRADTTWYPRSESASENDGGKTARPLLGPAAPAQRLPAARPAPSGRSSGSSAGHRSHSSHASHSSHSSHRSHVSGGWI